MQKVVDRELALEQAGGNPQLANELFSMLLKELGTRIETIKNALADGDHDTIQQEVHRINGAAAYCGVPALKSIAHRLDMQLKAGKVVNLADEIDALSHEAMRILTFSDSVESNSPEL